MRKVISLILAAVICSSLCMPAFAATNDQEGLPPWVGEGEIWVPSNGIMPLEDFGECPKGHTGPAGYKYEGYTIGQVTGHYDDAALVLTIVSIFSGNAMVVKGAALGAALLAWLDGKEDPNFQYFKCVYTAEGKAPYIHIIYTYHENGTYKYVSCETYYQI